MGVLESYTDLHFSCSEKLVQPSMSVFQVEKPSICCYHIEMLWGAVLPKPFSEFGGKSPGHVYSSLCILTVLLYSAEELRLPK